MNTVVGRVVLGVGALLCLSGLVSSAFALVAGIVLAATIGNVEVERTRRLAPTFLSYSVMGLGAGMNLATVLAVGGQGIALTLASIAVTLALGSVLGRALGVDRVISLLISVGTAICGGSAIAAAAPVLRAKSQEISVALGTVFLLNACALIVFPWIGHAVGLSEEQFGLWGALAIHDTSSVVGATMQYGAHALEVGTTVKLARALWIVPLTLGLGHWQSRRAGQVGESKPKRPWFILGFLVAAALVTYLPGLREPGRWVELAARRTLVLTLFLIGSNLTVSTLRSVGVRPLIQGVALWLLVAGGTLAAILGGVYAR